MCGMTAMSAESHVGEAPSVIQKVTAFVAGLVVGYFVPLLVVRLLLWLGVSLRPLAAAVISYLPCALLLWQVWNKKYVARGILSGAVLNALVLLSAIGLWWIASIGTR